jgi:two-component system, cell cycle response regulator
MRILIIEDSDSIRRMIEALVSARGYEVDAVSNGAKGLEVAFEKIPDVILLDLNLGGTYDGFEVCARVRESPLTRSTPVIVISALTDEESKQNAQTAGCTAYYTKPFSPIALLKEIESLRVRQRSTPGIL